MTGLALLARQTPTPEGWTELVGALSGLEGAALLHAVEAARPVLSWPARLRAVGADCPWLAGVFDGARDPRLELVGWASVTHQQRYGYMVYLPKHGQMFPFVAELARALDPTFDPPDVVLELEDNIRYASGCGGGERSERRGDVTRGVQFHDVATEHSADMSNDGSWVAYGLAEGCLLTVHRHDYIGSTWTFSASGPAPAIFEVAARWGQRGGESAG